MMFDIDIRKQLTSGARHFTLQVRFRSACPRVVILGPSGAGKSLTLKAIAGLMQPDSGHIRIGQRTLYDSQQRIHLAPQQRHVAYVFQDYALFPHLTVRQNIGFGLTRGWRNPSRDIHDDNVEHWLQVLHLQGLANQLPEALSGGQRQRVALARALATSPQALLLDEPFAALDPALRQETRLELARLQQRLEIPMLLITHDLEDADVFGDQILRLENGALIRQDTHGVGS